MEGGNGKPGTDPGQYAPLLVSPQDFVGPPEYPQFPREPFVETRRENIRLERASEAEQRRHDGVLNRDYDDSGLLPSFSSLLGD